MVTRSTLLVVVVWQSVLIVALHSHGFCSGPICQGTLMLLLMVHVKGVMLNDGHEHFLQNSGSHSTPFQGQIQLAYQIKCPLTDVQVC